MPITAEFEEKNFEGPLNNQLLGGSRLLYTPGQVLEELIGFDAALHAHSRVFWSLWNRPTPAPGAAITWTWWKGKKGNASFPAWKVNLLVQYKRPEYLFGRGAGQYDRWMAPYYRYEITAHQHEALRAASTKLGAQGLVVYASPGFHTLSALFDYTQNGKLVQNTNFVEARRIKTDHHHYTYRQAGKGGWACSDPEEVPSIEDLPAHVERVVLAQDTQDRHATAFLLGTSEVMDNVAARFPRAFGNDTALIERATAQILQGVFDGAAQGVGEIMFRYEKELRAYVRLNVLCWAGHLEWIVAGTPTL